jgi:hypothetical protein
MLPDLRRTGALGFACCPVYVEQVPLGDPVGGTQAVADGQAAVAIGRGTAKGSWQSAEVVQGPLHEVPARPSSVGSADESQHTHHLRVYTHQHAKL